MSVERGVVPSGRSLGKTVRLNSRVDRLGSPRSIERRSSIIIEKRSEGIILRVIWVVI